MESTKEWDSHEFTQKSLLDTKELRHLCASIGYDVSLNERVRSQIKRLRNLEVEIPDFDAFQKDIDNFITNVESYRSDKIKNHEFFLGNRELNDQIFAIRNDKDTVIKALNTKCHTHLPYDIEYNSIVRQPVDKIDFISALDNLEALFNSGHLSHNKYILGELIHDILEIRKELEKNLPHIDVLVQTFCMKVARNFNEASNEKMDKIYSLLWQLNYTQHEYGNTPDSYTNIELIAGEVKTYIANPWMHIPYFHNRILIHMLNYEVATKLPKEPSWKSFVFTLAISGILLFFGIKWLGWMILGNYFMFHLIPTYWKRHKAMPLIIVRDEIWHGNYNGPELARRLRSLELKGIYVNSLILALLDLHPNGVSTA
jgi:hypothetical protein